MVILHSYAGTGSRDRARWSFGGGLPQRCFRGAGSMDSVSLWHRSSPVSGLPRKIHQWILLFTVTWFPIFGETQEYPDFTSQISDKARVVKRSTADLRGWSLGIQCPHLQLRSYLLFGLETQGTASAS